MKEKLYNTLAWIARYLLPGLAALWAAVANIWGLPYATEITGTLAAAAAFINAVLGLSSVSYWQTHEVAEVKNADSQDR